MASKKSATASVIPLVGIIILLMVMFNTWIIMLLCGALWNNFGWFGAYSFWQCVPIAIALSFVSAFFRSSSKS